MWKQTSLNVLFLLIWFEQQVAGQYQVLHEENVNYCLRENAPMLLDPPYQTSELEDSQFVSLTWSRLNSTAANAEKLYELVRGQENPKISNTRFKSYQTTGLELTEPMVKDSAVYEVILVNLAEGRSSKKLRNVTIARAPQLKSPRLAVSQTIDEKTGLVILTCGSLLSLGEPQAPWVWRAPNGTSLPGQFKNGNLTIVITEKEGEGTFSCELDKDSPAYRCIPDSELDRWEGRYDFTTKTSSKNNGIIIIIVSVIVSLIGLIIISVVSFLLCKRCKKGAAYNTVQP